MLKIELFLAFRSRDPILAMRLADAFVYKHKGPCAFIAVLFSTFYFMNLS